MAEIENKTAATPGPWHERTRTLLMLEGCDQQEEVIEIGRVETDETVCYVPFAIEGMPIQSPDGRSEATARLIAAAPELRDLVARLLEQAQESANRHTGALDSDQATERDLALFDAWYSTLTEGFDARALLTRIEEV